MRGVRAIVILLGLFCWIGDAAAATPRAGRRGTGPVVQDYSSIHFLVHTDLPAKEAHELLRQLETEQKLLAAYWNWPAAGILECYVAQDFSAWPEDIIGQMEPEGVAKIREGAGVCIARLKSIGGKPVAAKSHLYAVARDRQGAQVPLHEAVHGYCQQTFGRTGPRWYAEGMAELGHYWVNNQKGIHVPDVVIRYLRGAAPRRIDELIVTDKSTGGTWQDYCWWWLLCHLLENNPNYTREFRLLGIALLTGKEGGFRETFGPRMKELTCEYGLFLKHLQNGYRVDLCALDWTRKFVGLSTAGRTVAAGVAANHGWQPSGATVTAGVQYAYSASGSWRVGKGAEPVGPDGRAGGEGRLVGAIMTEYVLGDEFELGASGVFKAAADGNLYLRCRVPWNQVADNSGRIGVKLKLAEAAGAPAGSKAMKPSRPKLESPPNPIARIDGREYLYFVGTGYLGLQGHTEVIRAACEAAGRYGLHAGTSRDGFGNTAPLVAVEQRAAEIFGCEDSFYFPVGYAGNIILLQAIESQFDAVFIDECSHYCVFEAVARSGRPVFRFRCRDAAGLADSLRRHLKPGERPLVYTDGVFTCQGTVAPLRDYLTVLKNYAGAGLAVDDAHGVGVLGNRGRGTFDHFGLFEGVNTDAGSLFLTATLSKALGGFGGIIPGSQRFIERVRKASHWYEGSTSPPAPVAAASARALELILADPDLRGRLGANVRQLREGLRAMGYDVDDSPAPVICLVAGDAENMRRVQMELMRQGIAVAYKAAYSGIGAAGCLRIAVFATHTEAMIRRLLDALLGLR